MNVPLYFFHVRGGHSPVEAEEGWEHAGAAAIEATALAAARSLIASDVLEGVLDLAGRIDVEDEAGELVLSVPFQSAVSGLDEAAEAIGPSASAAPSS